MLDIKCDLSCTETQPHLLRMLSPGVRAYLKDRVIYGEGQLQHLAYLELMVAKLVNEIN